LEDKKNLKLKQKTNAQQITRQKIKTTLLASFPQAAHKKTNQFFSFSKTQSSLPLNSKLPNQNNNTY
jgi:hypothetical protein